MLVKVKYFGVAHNLLDATKTGPELYTKKLGAGGVFAHDTIALKVGLFCRCTCVHVNYDFLLYCTYIIEIRVFALGYLVATAILQCGSRFPLFNRVVFDYFSG